jgi:hypothetical protein
VAKATNEVKQANESRADAALSPRFTPASARREAGIPTIPHQWHGRLEKFPVVLQQIFMPLLQPNLERLLRGEILRTGVFVPQIGVLEVKWKGDKVWASFVDALQWAYQILQQLRLFALALRYRTFCRSPEGGLWVWLPHQLVFPPDCRLTLPCAEYQVNLLGRSPPLWWQPTVRRLETTDEAQSQKKTSHWLTPSVPRAQRAPSALPIGAGAVGWV